MDHLSWDGFFILHTDTAGNQYDCYRVGLHVEDFLYSIVPTISVHIKHDDIDDVLPLSAGLMGVTGDQVCPKSRKSSNCLGEHS